MKLTASRLRGLIGQVIKENKMDLVEDVRTGDEETVMAAIRAKHPEIDVKSLGIMSGQNPDGIQASPEENEKRRLALEAEIDKLGLLAFRIGGVFFGNQENSILIINPHTVASETAGDFATIERDAKQVLDVLNDKFGQWGYVSATPDENAPGFALKYEMMAMDKYPNNVYDDKVNAPDENWQEFEDEHAGEEYMQGQPESHESHNFARRDPESVIAKKVIDLPDKQKDFYSYIEDPKKKKGIGKKFAIPTYTEGKRTKKLRIKRRK
jgi:hypothetical protein